MINKILAWSFFGCLIIALLLSLNGITQVGTDKNFYYFLSIFNENAKVVKSWNIPKIPDIPQYQGVVGAFIIDILRGIAQAIVVIINILIYIINIIWNVILFIAITITSISEYVAFVTYGWLPEGMIIPNY